jgi:hypothetical protein
MTTLVNPKLKRRKSVSCTLAVAAIILLTVDTINTFTSRGGYGFLGLTDRQSGYTLDYLPYSCFLYHLDLDLDKKQE